MPGKEINRREQVKAVPTNLTETPTKKHEKTAYDGHSICVANGQNHTEESEKTENI